MDPNSFHSTVLGRSSDDATAKSSESSDHRRRAIDILNPEPESALPSTSPRYSTRHSHSYSPASTSSHRAHEPHHPHDGFALRSPPKEYRPLASPSASSVRAASPASVGPSVSNLLNTGPVPRSRSPMLAPPFRSPGQDDALPAQREKGKFYDPLTDTTTAAGAASSSADRHPVSFRPVLLCS